jgi:hypothetical protein
MRARDRWLMSIGLAVVTAGLLASLLWIATCAHDRPELARVSLRQDGPRSPAATARSSGDGAGRSPATTAEPAPASEEHLMARLRLAVDARPEAALALVQLGETRYATGRFAEERAWLKMRALVHRNEIAAARDEATLFFERHPRSPFGERVYRLTGVHPRPRPGPR